MDMEYEKMAQIRKMLEEHIPELREQLWQKALRELAIQDRTSDGCELVHLGCSFDLRTPGRHMKLDLVLWNCGRELRSSMNHRVRLSGFPDWPVETTLESVLQQGQQYGDELVKRMVESCLSRPGIKSSHAGVGDPLPPKPRYNMLTLLQLVEQTREELAPELHEYLLTALTDRVPQFQSSLNPLPDWLLPVAVSGCSVSVEMDSLFHLNVSCEVHLSYGDRSDREARKVFGGSLLQSAPTLEAESLRERIRQENRDLVEAFRQALQAEVPAFEVVSPSREPGSGFPPELRTLLLTGKTSLGPLSVESDFRSSLASQAGEDSLFLALDPAGNLSLRTLPFLYGRKSSSLHLGFLAEGAEEATDPASLAGAWRLLNSLAERYPSADFGDFARPERLSVQLVGSTISSVSFKGMRFTPKGLPRTLTEESVRIWTDLQLETMRNLVYDLSHEREAQTRIFSSQNPTVLAILQHVYGTGRSHLSRVVDTIGGSLMTTKASVDHYLEIAAELEVPVKGKMRSALRTRLIKGDYQRYTAYYPNPDVDATLVALATPGPFTIEDLPNLTPAGRDQWLLDLVSAANTPEKRQEVLDVLGTHIPKTVASAFVKSGEGQSFLRCLRGEEADAARSLLEQLPGCKKLSKVVGESDKDGENAAQPDFLSRRTAIARVPVKDYLSAFSKDHLIEAGRQLDRRFVLHVGLTNSGKTWKALQELRQAKRGVYLGPLRLLALEVFDTLNADGCPCALLTGEEHQDVEGARITASTIEMADYSTWFDVAVIDECQMLRDEERGSHWLRAIVTLAAKEIHLCLAPEALDVVVSLLGELNAPYTLERHERLAPLSFAGSFSSLEDVEQGDALITFSRKSVLAIAAELERIGIQASVIYGALPPLTRREEVRRFREKETTVVVATDAIGMGISLPIRRVIFCQTSKYDGKEVRPLKPHEVQQIGGRAGRFGIYDKGEVLAMSDPNLIRRGLGGTAEPIRTVMLPFPQEALDTRYNLRVMLKAWNALPPEKGWDRSDMSNAVRLLDHLQSTLPDDLKPDKKTLFSFITCPVDSENGALVRYWAQCCVALLRGQQIPRPDNFQENDLEDCEQKYRALDIEHQMGRRGGVEIDNMTDKQRVSDRINAFLRQSKNGFLRRCSCCGKILPPNTTFGMCDSCHNRMHRRRWYDDPWDFDEDDEDEDFW